MKHVFICFLLSVCVRVEGFSSVVSEEVSVIEGDSVTLYSDETFRSDMKWYFNEMLVTEFTGDKSEVCIDDQCDERFRDRLKLDHQTGSLTIMNITTADSGEYKLQYYEELLTTISISVSGASADERDEMKRKSVKEGESVTLDPGVTKTPSYLMKWIFNEVRIAEINGDLSFICADVQCLYSDERFRYRLKLNHMTGSLTIMNTRITDSGEYKLQFISSRFSISKSFIVDVTGVSGVERVSVSVMEGDSVTLNTDVKTNQQEEIRWYFNDIRIAQITRDLSFICADVQCKYSDERFRDRLKLDHQTGSLTIMNTTNTDSGVYHLQIISSSNISTKTFAVSVYGVSAAGQHEMMRKSVKEGESVTLDPGVTKNTNDVMKWYFNEILITEITGDQSKICTDDQCDERFRDRLKLDHQTGSLTIMNTRNTDEGEYKLQINSIRFSFMKNFSVSVIAPDSGLSSKVGISVAVVLLLLLVVAAVIFYRNWKARQNDIRIKFIEQVNRSP